MAEIDDSELQRLRGAERLMNELISSPKTQRSFQRDIKTLHPDYVTDEEKAKPFVEEATKAAQGVLDAHLKKTRDAELETRFQERLDYYRLSSKNPDGYTDEGIEKIKNLMRERTIPDVDAAVALFEKLNPQQPEPPSGYHPTGWNFGAPADKEDTDRKLLFEDEDAWADREAKKVWDESRKGNLM